MNSFSVLFRFVRVFSLMILLTAEENLRFYSFEVHLSY